MNAWEDLSLLSWVLGERERGSEKDRNRESGLARHISLSFSLFHPSHLSRGTITARSEWLDAGTQKTHISLSKVF